MVPHVEIECSEKIEKIYASKNRLGSFFFFQNVSAVP